MPLKNFIPFLLLFLSLNVQAQVQKDTSAFQMGSHYFHFGVGYPNLVVIAISGFNQVPKALTSTFSTGKGSATPQFNISYDYGITPQISIGPYLGYAQATTPTFKWDLLPEFLDPFLNFIGLQQGEYSYKISVTSIGGKANYHRPITDKLDIYAVGIVGMNLIKIKEKGTVPNAIFEDLIKVPVPEMSFSGSIGGRYFFSDYIGMYGEVGYGSNVVNLGLAIRLGKKQKVSNIQPSTR